MPQSASARIANEAILETAISITTERLSVVLRTNTGGTNSLTGEGYSNVSITQLRRYAGEIYSMAWDAAVGLDEKESSQTTTGDEEAEASSAGPITQGKKLLDLIVYPQNEARRVKGGVSHAIYIRLDDEDHYTLQTFSKKLRFTDDEKYPFYRENNR